MVDHARPSLELVEQWLAEVWHEGTPVAVALSDMHIATRAAEWGSALAAEPPAPDPREADGAPRLRQCPTHGQQPANAWACPECLRELREELARLKAPAANGEREELARLLIGDAECLEADQPDLMSIDNQQLRRAAALLREPAPAPVPGWQAISTAPQDGTEILASDHDVIEIVSWSWDAWETGSGWIDRNGQRLYPAWWQPIPDHPPTPQPPQDEEVEE